MPRDPAVVSLHERVHQRLLGEGRRGDSIDDAALAELVRAEAPLLGAGDVTGAVARVQARVSGAGEIEPLLADPAVSDVLVNGPGPVWVERAGGWCRPRSGSAGLRSISWWNGSSLRWVCGPTAATRSSMPA